MKSSTGNGYAEHRQAMSTNAIGELQRQDPEAVSWEYRSCAHSHSPWRHTCQHRCLVLAWTMASAASPLQKFIIYAPDKMDVDTFQRRLAV